jgi:hypothetical protein
MKPDFGLHPTHPTYRSVDPARFTFVPAPLVFCDRDDRIAAANRALATS